jgi:hypothetical protein
MEDGQVRFKRDPQIHNQKQVVHKHLTLVLPINDM